MDDPGPSTTGVPQRAEASTSMNESIQQVSLLDMVVFGGLETLGTLAILGNLSLIVVLLRNKYLNRASFMLMLSLAIADVLHGLVTTCYFYPPILLKRQHISIMGRRVFNIIDWTAWAITLTHMSAICLDRLVAIMFYDRYSIIVTVPRVRGYSMLCWTFFLVMNTVIFFMKVCCIITPLASESYYTFGYETHNEWNFYVLTYTPIEIATICILSVSNPITLVQLYRRHKRKVALRMQGTQKISEVSNPSLLKAQRSQWQRASTMLLEMSMKMGNRQVSNDVREIAARRANRQQQRILLQISVVALIFYAYMTAYYISYYVAFMQSTAAMIFNSFFYSTTHMINPVIYFSLNKEMRQQLKQSFRDLFDFCLHKKTKGNFANSSSKMATQREFTVDRVPQSHTSETSPLFSTTCHYKSTGPVEESVVPKQQVIPEATADEEDNETQPLTGETPKLLPKDRSTFINDLIKALQYESQPALNSNGTTNEPNDRKLGRQRSMDGPRTVKGRAKSETRPASIDCSSNQRYLRNSSTLQLISTEEEFGSDHGNFYHSKKFSSLCFDKRPLIDGENESEDESSEGKSNNRTPIDSADLNGNLQLDDSSDEEIAYL